MLLFQSQQYLQILAQRAFHAQNLRVFQKLLNISVRLFKVSAECLHSDIMAYCVSKTDNITDSLFKVVYFHDSCIGILLDDPKFIPQTRK